MAADITTHHLDPPFPSEVPTASLEAISFNALQQSPVSSLESSKLSAASRNLGFFYLNFVGSELGEIILREVEALHLLQQEFYSFDHEVKDEYG